MNKIDEEMELVQEIIGDPEKISQEEYNQRFQKLKEKQDKRRGYRLDDPFAGAILSDLNKQGLTKMGGRKKTRKGEKNDN